MMLMPLLIAIVATAPEVQPQTLGRASAASPTSVASPDRDIVPQARASNFKGLSQDADVMELVSIVMMESSKSAGEDLKAVMEGMKRLNKEKQEARELLSAMREQQQRLNSNAALRRDQGKWAESLSGLCPPGTEQDDCLLRQLRLRTAVLKQQPGPPRP